MGTYKKLLLALLIIPLALNVKGETGKVEGILHGYVTDAITKKPLCGVIVSAIVPGTNSLKEVLTDADGYFRFVQLPASEVTVQFDKKGYQSFKRQNISVKEKSSVKLNVEFTPNDTEAGADNTEYPVLGLMRAG